MTSIYYSSREYLSGVWREIRNFHRACFSLRRGVEFVLKLVGSTNCNSCRIHTNIVHISAGIGFWAYIDWEVVLIE
jgi:hypothetical protein